MVDSPLQGDLRSRLKPAGQVKVGSRRQVDAGVIASWVSEGESVLDLGCGRGRLLEYLRETKGIEGVGVDISSERIGVCVRKGLSAYQGDIAEVLREFPDGFFDRVVFSRTVEELADSQAVLLEALRVGKRVAVGFINHGFWKNRIDFILTGMRRVNQVYPRPWWESRPTNPLSKRSFEAFCKQFSIRIHQRFAFAADWQTPCAVQVGWLAGYLIYDVGRENTAER